MCFIIKIFWGLKEFCNLSIFIDVLSKIHELLFLVTNNVGSTVYQQSFNELNSLYHYINIIARPNEIGYRHLNAKSEQLIYLKTLGINFYHPNLLSNL